MPRRPTPSPDPDPRTGFFLVVLFLAVIGMAFSLAGQKGTGRWTVIFAVPLIATIIQFLYEKFLLRMAKHKTELYGIVGVLVTSESPNWKQYIEDAWLPRFGSAMHILNWSERRTWRRSIYTILYYRFAGSRENHCPCIILLRGLKPPLVFRFHNAFRDAKHGNRAALIELERRLFTELDNMKTDT